MAKQRTAGSQALFDLLRQLALGLGTHRLFPDDPEQPGMAAAVERIREHAGKALALNARHAEIRSGRFRDGHGDELSDEHVDRLAASCFERGVEFLTVRDVPSAAALRSIFQALSLTEAEVVAQGGIGTILQRDGVVALRLGDVKPEGDPDADHALSELTAEQLDVWRTVLDPERFAANLLVEGLGSDEASAAQDVYRRFETVRAILPVALTADPAFIQNLIRVVEALPGDVRREFGAHTITRARAGDEMAEYYLGSMTDPELAGVLVDLQEADGPDARDVAAELVQNVGRQGGIVEVTTAFLEARGLIEVAGGDEVGSLVAALSEVEAGPATDSLARDTAADLFASRLLAATDRDIQELRAEYPDSPEARRTAALEAFRDYLLNEQETERLGQALEVWAAHLREAIAESSDAAVDDLFAVFEAAHDELEGDEKLSLIQAAAGRILDVDLLRSVTERAKHETETPTVIAILRRFGYLAEDALLDLLANEENRGTRATLVSMIAELATDDADAVVGRLADDRWFVVRNCVTILGRLPDRSGVRHLTPLVDHPHPQVRRELVRALLSSAGSDAVPYLERLARDTDEAVQMAAITAMGSLVAGSAAQALGRVVDAELGLDQSRRAVDELRRHASPVASDVLTELTSRGHRPKLPRAVRKHAKSSLSERKGKR